MNKPWTLRPFLNPLADRQRTTHGALSATRLTEGAPVLPQESGWRTLANFGAVTDPVDLYEVQRKIERLWLTHPLVGQIVGLMGDFTVGAGLTVTARDPEVVAALGRLMAAQPGWPELPRAIASHLAVYGEAFLVIRDGAGSVADKTLLSDRPHPLPHFQLVNATEVRRVIYHPDGTLAGILREYAEAASVDVERLARDPRSGLVAHASRTAVEFIAGERVVHLTAQAGQPGSRGVPPLARVIPWIEKYDQWLEDRVRINKSRGSFAFLRKVPGWGLEPTSPTSNAAQPQPVPRPGSVLVVSDQESWQVLAPQVGAEDASADGRALKLMVLAGAGIAEHYLGDLAQSNLATARAAELPMLKRFEAHQVRVLTLIREALHRALALMGVAGDIECTLPHPGVTDSYLLTRTLKEQIALGLISVQTARSLIPWISDVEEESRRVEAEAGTREEHS